MIELFSRRTLVKLLKIIIRAYNKHGKVDFGTLFATDVKLNH